MVVDVRMVAERTLKAVFTLKSADDGGKQR